MRQPRTLSLLQRPGSSSLKCLCLSSSANFNLMIIEFVFKPEVSILGFLGRIGCSWSLCVAEIMYHIVSWLCFFVVLLRSRQVLGLNYGD